MSQCSIIKDIPTIIKPNPVAAIKPRTVNVNVFSAIIKARDDLTANIKPFAPKTNKVIPPNLKSASDNKATEVVKSMMLEVNVCVPFSEEILLNHFVIAIKTGSSAVQKVSPICSAKTPKFSDARLNFSFIVLDIFLKASSVAPAEFLAFSKLSFSLARPVSLSVAVAKFNALTDPNKRPIVSIFPPVLSLTSCKKPAKPSDFNAVVLNSNPSFLA